VSESARVDAAPAPEVSVVVPVYNSQDCLAELLARLTNELTRRHRSHEIILVNDGSPDGSWEQIVQLSPKYPALRGVNLRRNFGQDNALMAGLTASRGRVVVIMDDDLQHDPADMAPLIRRVEEGADVCYACFARKEQAAWKNLGSWFNDLVANFVIGKPKGIYLSPYKAISRAVVREILSYDGPYPYVDGLLFRVTKYITQEHVQHHPRFAGQSNYSLRRSVQVWLRVATNFSPAPLRLASYLGLSFSGLGLLLALGFVVVKLLRPESPMGWASTIVTILVLGGVQLACLGIIGEFLGRAYMHINRQSQYVVKEETGPK
jgi:polyisoprenyl-phosphate glycosyltransferase